MYPYGYMTLPLSASDSNPKPSSSKTGLDTLNPKVPELFNSNLSSHEVNASDPFKYPPHIQEYVDSCIGSFSSFLERIKGDPTNQHKEIPAQMVLHHYKQYLHGKVENQALEEINKCNQIYINELIQQNEVLSKKVKNEKEKVASLYAKLGKKQERVKALKSRLLKES